eukprot:2719239-Amphidinium_carterae.1
MLGMNAMLMFFWYYTAEVLVASVYSAPLNGTSPPAAGALVGEYGWIHEDVRNPRETHRWRLLDPRFFATLPNISVFPHSYVPCSICDC